MSRVVLTEGDLCTIINALVGLASACRDDAKNAPDTPAGKYLRAASTQSAEQYERLAKRIEEAEEIVVEL